MVCSASICSFASTNASSVDLLTLYLTVVCGTVGLLVAVLMIYFCVRYRRRPGETTNPPANLESHALEWFWTLTPIGIFIFTFVWSGAIYYAAFSPPADAGCWRRRRSNRVIHS